MPFIRGPDSGYRSDTGSGSVLLAGCRCYDAFMGRFLKRDTDPGQSPYAYCGGDPVNRTDPSGHNAELDDILGWGIMLGGGMGSVFQAIKSLQPVPAIAQTTTPATFSFLWGAFSYTGATTTVTTQVGLGAASQAGFVGCYAAGLAAACYGAYHLSDWFTSNTAPGQALTSGLGGVLYRMEDR